MRAVEILAVSPYSELCQVFSRIEGEFPGVKLYQFSGNLDKALEYIHTLGASLPDAVISRGGTAEVLRAALSIPVVDVGFSVFDILRTLQSAQLMQRKYAVVGFPAVAATGRSCKEILKYNYDIYEVHSRDDAERAMLDITRSGVELVVGDVVSCDAAREHEVSALLLTSGEESVRRALQEALAICTSVRRAVEETAIYKEVCQYAQTGIVVFDVNGNIKHVNKALLELDSGGLKGLLAAYIDHVFDSKQLHISKRYKGYLLDVRGLLIGAGDTGYAAFYINSLMRSSAQSPAYTIENFDEISQRGSYIFANPEYLQPIIPQLEQIGAEELPVMIYGEAGTGKTSVARAIHLMSKKKNAPFITISCDGITAVQWDALAENIRSPLYSSECSIYFKNIHALSSRLQETIDAFLGDTMLKKRNRIISSSAVSVPQLVSEGKFLHSLYLKLFDVSIYVPPLKERIKDIPVLASLCINNNNLAFSKQVVGFEPQALKRLTNFAYSLNFEQFQKLIKQLVITTTNCYITEDEVVRSVRTVTTHEQDSSFPLDLNKTLSEIERDIIEKVLAEEEQNQSAAAKRLNISRSTIWRKLN